MTAIVDYKKIKEIADTDIGLCRIGVEI